MFETFAVHPKLIKQIEEWCEEETIVNKSTRDDFTEYLPMTNFKDYYELCCEIRQYAICGKRHPYVKNKMI